METTSSASTLSPAMSTFLAIVLLVLIVFYFIQRGRKKKGKPPLKLSALFGKKSGSGRSGGPWYGNYKKLMTVEAFKKYADKTFVVFDIVTTGFDASVDRIIEIAAVRVSGGKITKQTFQQYVNPGCKIPAEVSKYNGITDDLVKNMPAIRPTLAEFLAFVGSDILVAHNGGYCAAFIDAACASCGYEAPKKYFDTMRLSVYWAGLPNRKLDSFLDAAGIPRDTSHRAQSDAEACAKLVIASFKKIK